MTKMTKVLLAVLVVVLGIAAVIYSSPGLLKGQVRVPGVNCNSVQWSLIFQGKAGSGATEMNISTGISEANIKKLVDSSCSFKVVRKDETSTGDATINNYECNVARYHSSTNLFECLGEIEAPESYYGLGSNILSLGFINGGSNINLFRAEGETSKATVSVYTKN